ncbi:MAG: hypothetical protein K2P58_12515 [Hyphomonadaceae bacterium]|nr:hypothetical protein [Hyphomonadaceae bacterium]
MIDPQLSSQLLLAFAGALMGATFGGLARWTATRRDRRLRLTLELYNEFQHPQFYHVREVAHQALERNGAMPAAYQASEGEAREAVASMVHFWEKVAQLLRVGALDESLMRRFFAQYARWWDELLCGNAVALADPEWGATLRDIDWLFTRLKRGERQGRRR